MNPSKIHSEIGPRSVGPLNFSADDCKDYSQLSALGIHFNDKTLRQMIEAADALQPTVTTASIPTPIQFLQKWLPGFVHVITQARKIDELLGVTVAGNWADEEVVQGILELTGEAVVYGDYTNVNLASWNPGYERRTIVRFEDGLLVGKLADARAGAVNINDAASKRAAAALTLDIRRNQVGFYGYNNGANRTYGLLNDPGLPAYVSVPATGTGNTTPWANKSFLQIIGDIRVAVAALRQASKDTIDPQKAPLTLAIASASYDFLTVTSDFGISVSDWISKTYPKMRTVSVPEFTSANGGENVFYLYADRVEDGSTDDGRVIVQLVPSKFQLVGVEQKAKGFLEDYSNATAGVMVKRPYAVIRRTGI